MEMGRKRYKIALFYLATLGAAIGIFLYINQRGWQLFPVQATERPLEVGPFHQINNLLHILLALVTVIIAARILGAAFKWIKQPPVLGEVIAGILLGPSLLGAIAPSVSSYILPSTAAPFLSIIAQLGIILYMFLVGLELDLKVLKKSGHATLAISHASIVFPFALGAVLSLWLYKDYAPSGVNFTVFSLFLGVSLSITAFPVLARILSDQGLQKTPLGTVALTCAALDDVTAWCLLAFVVSIAQSTISSAVTTTVLTFVYIAFMFILVKPLVKRGVQRLEGLNRVAESQLAVILVALLMSALATEFIGIHAIFGAFLLGAITPHDSKVASQMTDRLQDLVRVLFLPAFFAFTGMRTEIGLLSSSYDLMVCIIVILAAILGKFGGSYFAARFTGLSVRESAGLGILMNTRGLVELIVLNIGLDIGAISPRLFTILVVMALVTTFMTGPLLSLLMRGEGLKHSRPKPLDAVYT
jgi:Kef-type K+ transport system membrane component KefB